MFAANTKRDSFQIGPRESRVERFSSLSAYASHLFRGVVAACVLMLSACATLSPAAEDQLGKPAPAGRLMMLSGEDISLQADDGKEKVILFWATWCPYSKSAIERYEALARKYRRRTDVHFYAVSLDRNQDIGILESRIQEQDLKTVQHVFSGNDIEDEAFLSLHGTTIPYAVVIDRNGVVQFLDIGVSGLESYLDDTLGD